VLSILPLSHVYVGTFLATNHIMVLLELKYTIKKLFNLE